MIDCPKCQGFIVPDMEYDEQRRCVNCGLRLFNGHPANLPPFLTQAERARAIPRPPLVRVLTDDERAAYNAYMREYMRKRRGKRTGPALRWNALSMGVD